MIQSILAVFIDLPLHHVAPSVYINFASTYHFSLQPSLCVHFKMTNRHFEFLLFSSLEDIHSVPKCPTHFFKNLYWPYTVYLFNSFSQRFLGLIEHHGVFIDSGHYVSYIRQSNKWYHCDDKHITETKLLTLSNNVYLMFYAKEVDLGT